MADGNWQVVRAAGMAGVTMDGGRMSTEGWVTVEMLGSEAHLQRAHEARVGAAKAEDGL